MRISELLEARTPVEAVRVIFAPDKSGAMIIGGRVLRDERITIPKVFNKLNLKNVKNPGPGPLLFHGSIDKFSKFNNRSWFSADPMTASWHAGWKGYLPNTTKYMYVCTANLGRVSLNKDIIPGEETQKQLKLIYDSGYDSILLKGVSDGEVGPKTDLYNIKLGEQVKILKTWVITFEDVSKQKFEEIISGNIIPRPHTVDDPGLTEFKAGEKISQQEYDNNKEYGLTIH
jgi:hypothetical protein|tara:strand:- start:146 stop:835 length:690 start_codon:yes stop_codon:yes gene_type:complete